MHCFMQADILAVLEEHVKSAAPFLYREGGIGLKSGGGAGSGARAGESGVERACVRERGRVFGVLIRTTTYREWSM